MSLITPSDFDASFAKKLAVVHSIDGPIAGLSVQEICDRCQISRQTFYRYFESKDDMLCWVGLYFRRISIGKIGIEYTWREGYEKLFLLMNSEREFFKNLTGVDHLQQPAWNIYYDTFIDMLKARNVPITPQLEYAAWGQALMDLKFATRWCKHDMDTDPGELAALVVECIPPPLFDALELKR